MSLSQLSRSVEDLVVVVTGAASGMGRATAGLFAHEGARVALLDINQNQLSTVEDEIAAAGKIAKAWTLDLGDAAAIGSVVPEVHDHFGGIDILVNNAGLVVPTTIEADNFEFAWNTSLSIMLSAQAYMIRACLPGLRQSNSPRIINIASTEGLGATKGNSPYVAAKTGVIGLTRAMAIDLGEEGITVNCICPGPIRTAMTDAIPEEHKKLFARRRVALKRYGDPEEVAHATLNFALPASSFITGTVLPVDGGVTVKNA